MPLPMTFQKSLEAGMNDHISKPLDIKGPSPNSENLFGQDGQKPPSHPLTNKTSAIRRTFSCVGSVLTSDRSICLNGFGESGLFSAVQKKIPYQRKNFSVLFSAKLVFLMVVNCRGTAIPLVSHKALTSSGIASSKDASFGSRRLFPF